MPRKTCRPEEIIAKLREAEVLLVLVQGEHWLKVRSTNPLERLNKEVARRGDVVRICPNDASRIRRAGALLLEQNDSVAVLKAPSAMTATAPMRATAMTSQSRFMTVPPIVGCGSRIHQVRDR